MNKTSLLIVTISLIFSCSRPDAADLILTNGHIYTMNSRADTAAAIAIKDGRLLALGSLSSIAAFKNAHTTIIDLHGHTVLPGFTDSHIHPISGGLALLECNLADLTIADLIIDSIRKYAAHNMDHSWIRGENMWLSAFRQGNPHKALLDSIVPDRPVFISSSDGHNAWVNSRALALANITRETPDPLHGRIERDPITHEPTGTLRESAQDLVSQLLPKYTTSERHQALQVALQLANQYGLTSLVEASASPEYMETYLQLEQEHQLTAHINLSIYGDISKGMAMVSEVIALRAQYTPLAKEINLNQVKLFMDGVVEGKTAAMLSDYADDHHHGMANTSPDTAKAVIAALDKAGFQIHVHAIGDAAVRMTLDAFEYAITQNGRRDSRHHIAHLHVVHPDDYGRFQALGVIANIQALWATIEDSYMTDLNFPYLGAERIEWQYPIGSLQRAGATLAFGSDWNVSTQNPFYCMQVAVTRRGPDSIRREPWTPQHLLDRYEVVKGYTANGAFLTFKEHETGTLEKGKWADLIVLDQDPLVCDTFAIFKTQVLQTYFKGKLVYEKY